MFMQYTIEELLQKHYTQINRTQYGKAMLVSNWLGTKMAAGNQWKHLALTFALKAISLSSRNLSIYI